MSDIRGMSTAQFETGLGRREEPALIPENMLTWSLRQLLGRRPISDSWGERLIGGRLQSKVGDSWSGICIENERAEGGSPWDVIGGKPKTEARPLHEDSGGADEARTVRRDPLPQRERKGTAQRGATAGDRVLDCRDGGLRRGHSPLGRERRRQFMEQQIAISSMLKLKDGTVWIANCEWRKHIRC